VSAPAAAGSGATAPAAGAAATTESEVIIEQRRIVTKLEALQARRTRATSPPR
jgi:hypothetical protein